jgi:hypothetical protein
MGAWSMGVFDDDSALDFLGELTEAKDPLSLMNHSFVSVAARITRTTTDGNA